MNAAELLKKLDQARQLVTLFPEDTKVLNLQICGTMPERTGIQLHEAFQQLADANVLTLESLAVEDNPESEFLKRSISTGGFEVFQLETRKTPPPALVTPEAARA